MLIEDISFYVWEVDTEGYMVYRQDPKKKDTRGPKTQTPKAKSTEYFPSSTHRTMIVL